MVITNASVLWKNSRNCSLTQIFLRPWLQGFLVMVWVLIPMFIYGQTLSPQLTSALNQMGMVPFTDAVQSATFDLQDHEGNPVSLSDFNGQIVMINFWATWCGPCRTEMPSMQRMYDSFRDRGFVMLAVNSRENPRVVAQFIDEFGYTFPVALDLNGRVSFQYGVRSIPLTYLIDPDGRIIAGKPGAQEWDTPRIFQGIDQVLQIYGK